MDKRDRETSELTKSSIISKEQLEIDQGKMKKVKSEKVSFKIRVFSFLNLTVHRIFRSSEIFNHSISSITSIVAPLQFSENFVNLNFIAKTKKLNEQVFIHITISFQRLTLLQT